MNKRPCKLYVTNNFLTMACDTKKDLQKSEGKLEAFRVFAVDKKALINHSFCYVLLKCCGPSFILVQDINVSETCLNFIRWY